MKLSLLIALLAPALGGAADGRRQLKGTSKSKTASESSISVPKESSTSVPKESSGSLSSEVNPGKPFGKGSSQHTSNSDVKPRTPADVQRTTVKPSTTKESTKKTTIVKKTKSAKKTKTKSSPSR